MKNKLFILSILCSVSLLLYSCGNGCSKEQTQKKIAVTGSAELEIVPNEIYVTFTLKEYLDEAKQKVKLENIKSDFLALVKNAGIADSNVSISGYSGNERWDYYTYRRRRTEPDFMASIAFTVKAGSAEKLDAIVAGVNDKALDNFYIARTSHSDIERLRKEVKMNALKASKEKADYLAKSIGENIGEAILIQEIDNSIYSDVTSKSNMRNSNWAMATEMEDNNGGAAPDFEKITLRFEVMCEFALK